MQLTVDSQQLPVDWKIKTLDELCEIARGGSPRPIKNFVTNKPDGVNWIKISDASSSSKYIYETKEKIKPDGIKHSRLVNTGDFILSNSMSFGRPYIMRTSGCIHDGWLVLKDKSGLFDQDYLYYFLGSNTTYRQFDDLAAGSTVRNLNIDLVKGVKVTIPPLSEQKRIVLIVDEAFEAIDIAIDNTKQNLTNARELFESYLNAIFTQKGDGWKWVSLSEITTDITDGDHQPPPKSESGIPFITISNINKQDRTVDFSNTFKVSSEYFNKLKHNKKPRQGDILYTVTGSYGIPVVVDHALDFCFQRHIGLIRPDLETNSKCLYYMLLSRHLLNQADECATGTAQKTVSLSGLRRFSVPKIPKEQQETIVAELDILSEHICRLVRIQV